MGSCSQDKHLESFPFLTGVLYSRLSPWCFLHLLPPCQVLFSFLRPLCSISSPAEQAAMEQGKHSQPSALGPPAMLITPAPSLRPDQLPFLISQCPWEIPAWEHSGLQTAAWLGPSACSATLGCVGAQVPLPCLAGFHRFEIQSFKKASSKSHPLGQNVGNKTKKPTKPQCIPTELSLGRSLPAQEKVQGTDRNMAAPGSTSTVRCSSGGITGKEGFEKT